MLVFQRFMILIASVIYMGIVRSVCVFIAGNPRWKREKSKKDVSSEYIAPILLCTALYLYPKISHTLYVQNKWVSSMFFNVWFYMGNMCTLCFCITENARWKTGVLSEDIPAILLCTAMYLHPKSSHAFYFQYKTVSMFFNVLFYLGKMRKVWVCIK